MPSIEPDESVITFFGGSDYLSSSFGHQAKHGSSCNSYASNVAGVDLYFDQKSVLLRVRKCRFHKWCVSTSFVRSSTHQWEKRYFCRYKNFIPLAAKNYIRLAVL
jgi:hypothetical protein